MSCHVNDIYFMHPIMIMDYVEMIDDYGYSDKV